MFYLLDRAPECNVKIKVWLEGLVEVDIPGVISSTGALEYTTAPATPTHSRILFVFCRELDISE